MRGDGVRQPAAQIVRADEGRDAAALGILCDVDSRTRGGLPPLDVGGVGLAGMDAREFDGGALLSRVRALGFPAAREPCD